MSDKSVAESDVGMIGLAVMGANLARNLENKGFRCSVYNRTSEVTDHFVKKFSNQKFQPTYSLEELVSSLKRPRKIFLMIQAGAPVDLVLTKLLPLLSKNDIIIDGGNAYYKDTIRREAECEKIGINFIGTGISGGEEGALNGPSLMPGGNKDAWQFVKDIFENISAKVDGNPCVAYMGPNGAGHFVKTVHNGIEYGDMQLIAESYDLLRKVGGLKPEELSKIYASWNDGVLGSYLIEITSKIFKVKDSLAQGYLVDNILDKAGQKGTGKWTVQVAVELGAVVPTIASAVDARVISSNYDQRQKASKEFIKVPITDKSAEIVKKDVLIHAVHSALYASKIICYAQGMGLLKKASDEFKWSLNLSTIASIWKGGCIIRAKLLKGIETAFSEQPDLDNLLLAPIFKNELINIILSLREVVSIGAKYGVPLPAMSASLSYFESIICPKIPHNLLQAQRDFFGAHTYERVDRDGKFHTEWE